VRPTLFYIPHEFLGIPVLGFGWVLAALVAFAFAIAVLATSRKKQSVAKVFEEHGIVWGVAAVIVIFLLPQIETRLQVGGPTPFIVGLPIRGYGVMLMCGVLSAMGIAMVRCEKAGLSREAFFSLATWTVVAGMLGARVFYVVQKWNELAGETLREKLWTAMQVTEGGLVVYGSVIGGLIAIAFWSRNNRFPLLVIADCVTPAFFIGLAFGRIGCLLNGCCYGGLCETSLPSITFPAGSPAYMDQMGSGKLFGIDAESDSTGTSPPVVIQVRPNSWAAENRVQVGQKLIAISEKMVDGPSQINSIASPVYEATIQVDSRQFQLVGNAVPKRSIAVHPSQIYAAVSGLLLCLWTVLFSMIVKRTGMVIGAGIVAYGIQRIIEEIIRVDEAGQFGTSLSIAQWISIAGILFGICVIAKCSTALRAVDRPGHSDA
jgi:phosphatidylglycerol---prolipoprotein diacylglyceryl transferase